MKVATEMYLTLKSFSHYNCTVLVPGVLISEGVLKCRTVYCNHGAKEIAITRKDI